MKRITALILAVFAITGALLLTSCTKETMGGHPAGKLECTSGARDYKFYYPDTWQTDINNGMVSLYVSAEDPSNVSVTTFALGDNHKTLDDYISSELDNSFKTQWNALFGQTDFGTPVDIKLGGIDAKQYVYEVTIGGIDYKYMQVFALKLENVYTLTYAARTEVYDKHIKNVNEIIESFEFI